MAEAVSGDKRKGVVMKKRMIIAVVYVAILLVLILVYVMVKTYGTAISKQSEELYIGAPVTIIIGSANTDQSYLKVLKDAFPESVVIIPKKWFPFKEGAEDILRQIKEKGINGPVIAITHSISGLLIRQADIMNPGLVKSIVTIGTPHFGSYKLMPEFVSNTFFRPDDEKSKTPLCIIGGFVKDKDVAPKKMFSRRWHLINTISDGAVDLPAVMDLGKREVKAFAVFPDEHTELVSDPKVISQVKAWLEPKTKVASTTGK